jgi:hypothetical protein
MEIFMAGSQPVKNAFKAPMHDGRSDTINAVAKQGSYVMPADAVSTLGRGSSDAGAQHLDSWVKSHGCAPIGKVGMPKGKTSHMNLTKGAFANGGHVNIHISPDEYMFPHDFPHKLGGDDHAKGIAMLDAVRDRLHAHMRAGGIK